MTRHPLSLVACGFAIALAASALNAQETSQRVPAGDPAIVPAEAKVELLWNEGRFTEGPAAAPDGTIVFSDIAYPVREGKGRIMRFDPATGKTTVFVADSKQSNGLMHDVRGRLLAVCGALGGARALCEVAPDGEVKTLADRFEGKALNSPNDLVVDAQNRVYFTDPRYGGDEPLELDHMSLYLYDPNGTLRRVGEVTKPNGVILSPDGKTLYVADTAPVAAQSGTRGTIDAYSVNDDGTLSDKRMFADFGRERGTDGMTVDVKGNVYAACRPGAKSGVAVFEPQGKEIAFVPTPEVATNCVFGRGRDGRTLYITAGKSLYRVRLGIAGHHLETAAAIRGAADSNR
ncbi:MAG: SMP-30/gluconolactonase/LRE family protein [Planctomycetaceae bacterium]